MGHLACSAVKGSNFLYFDSLARTGLISLILNIKQRAKALLLLWSPVAACFTPPDSALYIVLGDLRLECSCLAMETYSMKVSTHCSSANLKTA